MDLKFNLLQKNDPDIQLLKELHEFPSIKKYISISENYFEYVVSEEKVRYYKVLCDDKLIGSVHLENDSEKMYLSICVHPFYQSRGYGRQILKYVVDNLTGGAKDILVSIDCDNTKSINLFESFGFIFAGTDGLLRDYIYKLK